MIATVRTRFDGEGLRPEEPLDLKVDETSVVTVIAEGAIEQPADAESDDEHPLTQFARLASDMGVDDLAERHDWYALHGLPNRPRAE